jgi:hypothetical protein
MITLIATAAVLSCNEAQRLIFRVNPEMFTRREYKDIVRVIKSSAPKRCSLVDNRHLTVPTLYRHNYPVWVRRPYYDHPAYRPGWRPPTIVFRGSIPSLTFRF